MNYELTVVLPGKAKAKEKSFKEKIEKMVASFKGKVEKSDSWGEIELSYIIKKERSGLFLHFNLEMEKENVKKFEEKLRVEDEIIRYLLISNK